MSQRRAALIGRLHSRRQREREGLVLVEGARAAGEALDAGASCRFAVISQRLSSTEAGRALTERLQAEVGDVEIEEDARFDDLASTESPQGVLLVCAQQETDLAGVISGPGPVLVLDALQDPGNVGTLIRSAVAFGFTGIVALDGTVDPWSSKVVRSSAGTLFRAALARGRAAETISALREAGRAILVAAADGADGAVVRADLSAPPTLVIGNEGAGVRDEFREAADAIVSVRMPGPVESLNAGIAGSILMHELTKE